MRTNLPRAVRALRLQKGMTQEQLAHLAGVSREVVSRLERRDIEGMTLSTIDRVVDVLGGTVHVNVSWRGVQLDRLMDAAHARIVQDVVSTLVAAGWVVANEVSFNHYGDRGRVDILAWHPARRIVLVVEVKSELGDLQETVGRLDVKVRLAPMLARAQGWMDVGAVSAALVISDSRGARSIVARHPAYFSRFAVRGRQASAWLRRPSIPAPGLLLFAKRPDSRGVTKKRRTSPAERRDSHRT